MLLQGTSNRWLSVLLAGGLASAACASAGTTAPPVAFPGAPPATLVRPETPVPRAIPLAEVVVETALAFRGTPYRLGGAAPDAGFDCSGLVYFSFRHHLIDVPRTVVEQFDVGTAVDLADVRRGDLIFFSTIGPGATHVGIVLGSAVDPTFVHAPSTGGVVRVERFDSSYWSDRFVGARRVV